MSRSPVRVAGAALLVACVLAPSPADARKRPQPCPDGRFVLDAGRKFLGAAPGATNVVVDAGRVALSPLCPLAVASVKPTRRGTVLRAAWTECAGGIARAKLAAVVAGPACERLRGTFAVPRSKTRPQRLRATRTPWADRVPTDPRSPWPKFRRDAAQTGLSPVRPEPTGGLAWSFRTGKGIFSSPVIGPDGTVYVGSADRNFYALARDGSVRWQFPTGEIIDSSALLDDAGTVYVGSGDGMLYARRAEDGSALWTFAADPPAASGAFINWFEANVAIGPDRTLYVPNDNFFTYAIDSATQAVRWRFRTADQTWSLPAVDVDRNRLVMGNNNLLALLGPNTFAIDAASGASVWNHATDGTIAASPMLTPDGLAVVGGFDGFVRAYDAAGGAERWRFGARDHIYASPALLPDGSVVQASADGSVYALDPTSGAVRWQFDTRDAIRSSPAVDADGRVYVGSGEGRLFVLNADGTLRWSLRLIAERRDDLNASPALGTDAVVIAGESGEVFSVPYDWCLRPDAAGDARCTLGPAEGLPTDGAHLYFTTRFGRQEDPAPAQIEANQPLAFSLFVRAANDTVLAHIDADSLAVTIDSTPAGTAPPFAVDVSGDRKFVTLVPDGRWTAPDGGSIRVRLAGSYLVNPDRVGLQFSGGTVGGRFDETFVFAVPPAATGGALPLPVPSAPGDPAGVWEISRFATPLPTILPSYNQIGFDSLHYLLTMVRSLGEGRAVGWVLGGRRALGEDVTRPDPATRVLFPVVVSHDGGLWTLLNEDGFSIEFNGIRLPFQRFRLATRVDATGTALEPPALDVLAECGGITFYGQFLRQLGFCNPQTDVLNVFGAAELGPWGDGVEEAPAGVGTVAFSMDATGVTATLAGSSLQLAEHVLGVLVLDPITHLPLALDYGYGTQRTANADGTVASVRIPFVDAAPAGVDVVLMVDAYPAATATLGTPGGVPGPLREAPPMR